VNSVFDGYGEASQPGQNDTRSATNASSPGDFGPYYPGGTGCRMETVKVRSRKVHINTVGEFCLGPQRS
jgi:hypothetical protein